MELYEKYEDYFSLYISVNFSGKYFSVVIIYAKCSNCLTHVNHVNVRFYLFIRQWTMFLVSEWYNFLFYNYTWHVYIALI